MSNLNPSYIELYLGGLAAILDFVDGVALQTLSFPQCKKAGILDHVDFLGISSFWGRLHFYEFVFLVVFLLTSSQKFIGASKSSFAILWNV